MQQKIRAATHPIHSTIRLPGSKGITLRALMLAALANGVSEISGMQIGEDTRILIAALHHLGIAIQLDETAQSCIVAGGNGQLPKKEAGAWCGNVELVTYFILAVCANTKGTYHIDGSNDLHTHSLLPLTKILAQQNAYILPANAAVLPITIKGVDALEGTNVSLSDTSHLIISALLMISPFARSSFQFTLTDTSSEEIDITCGLMTEFGVLTQRAQKNQLIVPLPQRYQARDYMVEPDFALATYYFAAAAVTNGEITTQSANITQSKQADTLFLTLLERMGCKIFNTQQSLIVNAQHELQGIDISLKNFSHSFLALLAIAPFAKTATHIKHMHTLDQTELDCFNAVKSELIKINIHFETGDNWIKIFPSKPNAGVVSTHGDYRIGMMLSIIGLKVAGIIINQSECVTNEYPNFFFLWDKLAEGISVNV